MDAPSEGESDFYVTTPRKRSKKDLLSVASARRPSSPRSAGNSPSGSPREEGTQSGSSNRARAGSDPRDYPHSPRPESPRSESPGRSRPARLQLLGGSSPVHLGNVQEGEIGLLVTLTEKVLNISGHLRAGSQAAQNQKITQTFVDEFIALKREKIALLDRVRVIDEQLSNRATTLMRSFESVSQFSDTSIDESSEEK